MRKFLIFVSVCLAFSLMCASAIAEGEKVSFTQTWDKVDGALGYRVEIQNSKSQTVVTKDVSQPSLDLELPVGTYQIRISGLNVFGVPESSTDWVKFVVRKIETPAIQEILPRHAQEETPFTLRIQAQGIDGKTKWRLVRVDDPDESKPVASLSLSLEGSEYCDVKFPGVAPGLYSLEAVGRTGKTGNLPHAVYVTEHDPLVTDFTPQKAGPQTAFSISIKGKYLQQVEKVELISTAETRDAVKAVLPVHGEGETLAAHFPAMKPGSYMLAVTSLNGQKLYVEKYFQVLMPKPTVKKVQVLEDRHQLVVQGFDWTDGMRAYIARDTRRLPLQLLGQTDTSLVAAYPEETPPGKYDLILCNNQGNEAQSTGAVNIRTSLSLSMQKLNEEEYQPISVTLVASARKDNLGWVLSGAGRDGKLYSVPALSAVWVADQSAWLVQFPGMPQGTYRIQATGIAAGEVDFPHEIVVSDHTPLLTKLIPEKAEAQQPFKWEAWGKYLKAGGKLELISDKDGKSYALDAKIGNDETRADGQIAELPSGSYALKATSPQGKVSVLPAALYVQIPQPIVSAFRQHPWDADKKLLKTELSGSKLEYASKAFLALADARTEIGIDGISGSDLVVSYPADTAYGTYDLILATADGRETVVRSAVELKAPAALRVGSVIHSAREPLVVRIAAPGVKSDSVWQLSGNDSSGHFVTHKPATVQDEGNEIWFVSFPPISEGSYHLSVTCADGKKVVFPGAFDVRDPSKLPDPNGSGAADPKD